MNILEATCPDGHDFNFLGGSVGICPECGWLFQVTPKTNKDFEDRAHEPSFILFPRRTSRRFAEECTDEQEKTI
jgi:hypothetical protein